MFIIFIILLILKLTGICNISWVWVLSPFWMPVIICFLLYIIIVFLFFFLKIIVMF